MKTTTRLLLTATLLLTLLFVAGSATVAQDDDLIGPLAELIAELFERVEALEQIWQAQGAPQSPDGSCALLQLDPAGQQVMLQKPTILHHLRQFDVLPIEPTLRNVRHDPSSGVTYLVYESWHKGAAYHALEGWRGCDFEEGTAWSKAEG